MSDHGGLGGLGEADTHPGEQEPDQQDGPLVLFPGEERVAQDLGGGSGCEDNARAEAIGQVSAAQRGQGRGAMWAAYMRMARLVAAVRLRPSACSRLVARRISSVVARLPSSNRAAGVRARASPAVRSAPMFRVKVRRPSTGVRVVRAWRAARVMLMAAKMPGMIARKIACRIPTTTTRTEASSGPRMAPALSPARSRPKARP